MSFDLNLNCFLEIVYCGCVGGCFVVVFIVIGILVIIDFVLSDGVFVFVIFIMDCLNEENDICCVLVGIEGISFLCFQLLVCIVLIDVMMVVFDVVLVFICKVGFSFKVVLVDQVVMKNVGVSELR